MTTDPLCLLLEWLWEQEKLLVTIDVDSLMTDAFNNWLPMQICLKTNILVDL